MIFFNFLAHLEDAVFWLRSISTWELQKKVHRQQGTLVQASLSFRVLSSSFAKQDQIFQLSWRQMTSCVFSWGLSLPYSPWVILPSLESIFLVSLVDLGCPFLSVMHLALFISLHVERLCFLIRTSATPVQHLRHSFLCPLCIIYNFSYSECTGHLNGVNR